MEDKKEYLRDMAREHWECGHPFSSDDFRYFQGICKDDGFDVNRDDWNYYWECYDDCRTAQYEEDIPVSDSMNRDINDAADWYKTSQIEGIMMSHQCSAEKAKEILGINPSYKYIPSGQLSLDEKSLTEAAGEKNARRRVWGSDWNAEHTGASNLDFFGEYLLDEIKSNLEGLTCNVGGRQRMAIDMARTEISIDKDPAPNESVKERRIRGWVYFNSNFDIIMEDRQVLKQKTIQAFKAGMADFNDKYKMDYLVCKDMVLFSKSFKYGNDNKSMYFVFKVEEEKYHNEKPQAVIVHKHSRESKEMFDSILNESYHGWEDFYKKGCKLGLNSYMTKLDILHDKYGGFKNVPKDKIQPILDEIPDSDYDVYNFVEEMIDYFDF
jgi:hypothetical protein